MKHKTFGCLKIPILYVISLPKVTYCASRLGEIWFVSKSIFLYHWTAVTPPLLLLFTPFLVECHHSNHPRVHIDRGRSSQQLIHRFSKGCQNVMIPICHTYVRRFRSGKVEHTSNQIDVTQNVIVMIQITLQTQGSQARDRDRSKLFLCHRQAPSSCPDMWRKAKKNCGNTWRIKQMVTDE